VIWCELGVCVCVCVCVCVVVLWRKSDCRHPNPIPQILFRRFKEHLCLLWMGVLYLVVVDAGLRCFFLQAKEVVPTPSSVQASSVAVTESHMGGIPRHFDR